MPSSTNNSWVPLAQWIAVISMTLDHAARYLQPDNNDYFWLVTSLGRWAFPAFAALMAWHALYNSRNLKTYLLRVLALGIISQPFYAWMKQEPFLETHLNVCFTLALGLLLVSLVLVRERMLARESQKVAGVAFWLSTALPGFAALVVLALASLLDPWMDYGYLGVLFVPLLAATYHFFRRRHQGLRQRFLWGVTGVLSGLLAIQLNTGFLASWHTLLAFCLMFLLPWLAQHLAWRPLPFPRWLWLSWYPLHLAVIGALARFLA